jgi:hypothetical protein
VITLSTVLTATFLGTIFTVRVGCANIVAFVSSITLFAVAFSVVGVTECSVEAIALLFAFFAVVIWWANCKKDEIRVVRGGKRGERVLTDVARWTTITRLTLALVRCCAVTVNTRLVTLWNALVPGRVFLVPVAALPNRSSFLVNFVLLDRPQLHFSFPASEWGLCTPNILHLLIGDRVGDDHCHVVVLDPFAHVGSFKFLPNNLYGFFGPSLTCQHKQENDCARPLPHRD